MSDVSDDHDVVDVIDVPTTDHREDKTVGPGVGLVDRLRDTITGRST